MLTDAQVYCMTSMIYLFRPPLTAKAIYRKTAEAKSPNTYGEAAISERTCCEWFQRFKNGDFDVEDRHSGGREKVFEDAELEALLEQDSCQTQEELARSLGDSTSHIKTPQSHGNDSEARKLDAVRIEAERCWMAFVCLWTAAWKAKKGFLHRIVTGEEKWVHYDNPKRRKSWGFPGHAFTSTAKPNIHGSKVMLCIWWDQLDVVMRLWTVKTDWNNHRRSVSNAIDAFEPSIERQTAAIQRETW